MSDPIDKAQEAVENHGQGEIEKIRQAAASIPKGEPGECHYCGEEFSRLVGGACGRCRDKYGLP